MEYSLILMEMIGRIVIVMMFGLSFMDSITKNKVNILLVIIITIFLSLGCIGCTKVSEDSWINMGANVVGKTITEDKFREFYYTYSTTVNPPEFQRYQFFKEDGKAFFYHEKREGNNTFLTEEDITIYGTKELSNEEWTTFWNLINGGSVVNRKENVNSGNSGPWLFLYWNGDKDKCQEFTFKEYEDMDEFEAFCESLVNSMQE